MKAKTLLILLMVLCSHLVSGTYISLTTQVSKEEIILEDETELEVKLVNSGDEPAYQVQVNFVLPSGFQAPPISVGNLEPNKPYTKKATLKIDEIVPGTYPLGVLTYYQDANGYPFSSPSFFPIVFQEVTASSVFGALQPLTLSGQETKEATLKVRNLDNAPHQVKATLFLPRELVSTANEKILDLAAKEEREITFDVSSFGALPGSSYPLFVSLDYKENNLHYSSLARGTVSIVEKKEAFTLPEWFPLAALGVLILIVVIYQLKK